MAPLITPTTTALNYAEALNEKFSDLAAGVVSAIPGRVYDRIILTEEVGGRILLGFLKRSTGELIAPESWAVPLSDEQGLAVRFHLNTPEGFAAAIEAADPEGSFLTDH